MINFTRMVARVGWDVAAIPKKGGPGEINSAFCITLCHNLFYASGNLYISCFLVLKSAPSNSSISVLMRTYNTTSVSHESVVLLPTTKPVRILYWIIYFQSNAIKHTAKLGCQVRVRASLGNTAMFYGHIQRTRIENRALASTSVPPRVELPSLSRAYTF